MERGIYEQHCRMYAPYYRQAVLADYDLPIKEAEPYFNLAYKDVRAAFVYYMQHENNGRPFVLAGFSQGAEMCLRLLKEFGNEGFVKNTWLPAMPSAGGLRRRKPQNIRIYSLQNVRMTLAKL